MPLLHVGVCMPLLHVGVCLEIGVEDGDFLGVGVAVLGVNGLQEHRHLLGCTQSDRVGRSHVQAVGRQPWL